MAVLDEASRIEVWAELMRKFSRDGETIGIIKPDLRAAVDALDDYMDANAAVMNNELPQPARAELTSAQKAIILSFVVLKRYKVIL